jgi:hypothetical protein
VISFDFLSLEFKVFVNYPTPMKTTCTPISKILKTKILVNSREFWIVQQCRNLRLGLTTKARAYKSASQERSPGVTFHVPGSTKEWGNEPSHSQRNSHFGELKSWWTPESSKSDCRGQNALDWGVHYIIGKLLERRCPKWACMIHLDT